MAESGIPPNGMTTHFSYLNPICQRKQLNLRRRFTKDYARPSRIHQGHLRYQSSSLSRPMHHTPIDRTIVPVKGDLRVAQVRAADDPKRKFTIAKAIVEAKIARNLEVVQWISESHDVDAELRAMRFEASKLVEARTVPELRVTEARVAEKYWKVFQKILPPHLEFQSRMTSSRNNNASDPANSAWNFGFAILEGECRRAINAVGLEPAVGFLHELSTTQTRQSLTYDLMEPFRWLIDLTVLQAFESRVLDLDSFHFKFDDYRFRFNPEAKERFIGLLKERFNNGVNYRGQRLMWDTVIEQKAVELGRFLIGRTSTIDFMQPSPNLERLDSRELRERINSLTSHKATKLGIGRAELHYLREKARSEKSFRTYGKVREKLLAL